MANRINKPDTEADIALRQYLDQSASFVMVAGAGSGKTTSLVKALDHLGKTYGNLLRERGQKIACITYTEIATDQIYGDVGHDPLFHVSTIHSFLWSLIKPFQNDIKFWVGGRIEEKLSKLKEERDGFGSRVQQKTRDKNQRETEKYELLRTCIAAVPRFGYATGSDYANGILGHDDIIKMGPALIQQRPLLRKLVAQKYPYFFVDESQDTVAEVVEALKAVDLEVGNKFCLGFFGDPMQKIYSTGIGRIELEAGWAMIKKPENFRSSAKVLSVINNIRRAGDDLQQTMATKRIDGIEEITEVGSSQIFILPADGFRKERLLQVRHFIAGENEDPMWISDEKQADVKMLVIVHRMAANRLGFDKIYSALNDDAPDSFKTGLAEGTLWVLKPFLNVLLPLVEAFKNDNQFETIGLLRTHSPRLRSQNWKDVKPVELLSALNEDVSKLTSILSPDSSSTILEVLQFVNDSGLIELDGRFNDFLKIKKDAVGSSEALAATDDESEIEKRNKAMTAFFICPASQLWGYRTYIEDKSPYSTQHGVKGDEFERVLVVLDDEEATYNLYSYEKLLGIQAPSSTDIKNQSEGKDSVFDRTRRLFYVCCSRAVKDLAVVFFTSNPEKALQAIKESNIFEPDCVKTIADLPQK